MSMSQQRTIQDINNQIADGYDQPGSYFFLPTALRIMTYLVIQPNDKILDVCTGTGFLALNIAEQYPSAQVVGVDIAERMLEQAVTKAKNQGFLNVDFRQMDLNHLTFDEGEFQFVLCNYGLFFVDDMCHGLQQMLSKTKSGGTLAFSVYDVNAFAEPVALLKADYQSFREQLGKEDIPAWKASSSAWKVLSNDESIRALCQSAGLEEVAIHHEPQGFRLKDGAMWWDIIWHSTYQDMLQNMGAENLGQFRQKHLSNMDALCVDEGYWVDASSIIVIGKK